MREVILYPGEDGYWIVECPSLPRCVSQGKTKEEILKNIKEAINCYIHALEEDSTPYSGLTAEGFVKCNPCNPWLVKQKIFSNT